MIVIREKSGGTGHLLRPSLQTPPSTAERLHQAEAEAGLMMMVGDQPAACRFGRKTFEEEAILSLAPAYLPCSSPIGDIQPDEKTRGMKRETPCTGVIAHAMSLDDALRQPAATSDSHNCTGRLGHARTRASAVRTAAPLAANPSTPGELGGSRARERDQTVSNVSADDAAIPAITLTTGAEMRVTGLGARPTVRVNGGQAARLPGTWSASLEWLVRRIQLLPGHRFLEEARYRVKSWHALELCEEDTRAAVAVAGAPRTLLSASRWVGPSLSAAPTRRASRAFSAWRRGCPTASSSTGSREAPRRPARIARPEAAGHPRRQPVELAQELRPRQQRGLGIEGTYRLIPGAVHGIAIRARSGVVPLPGARRWAALVGP